MRCPDRLYGQNHNPKVGGSSPSPATTFTEPRYGSLSAVSAPGRRAAMLAISPTRSASDERSFLLGLTTTLSIFGQHRGASRRIRRGAVFQMLRLFISTCRQ